MTPLSKRVAFMPTDSEYKNLTRNNPVWRMTGTIGINSKAYLVILR